MLENKGIKNKKIDRIFWHFSQERQFFFYIVVLSIVSSYTLMTIRQHMKTIFNWSFSTHWHNYCYGIRLSMNSICIQIKTKKPFSLILSIFIIYLCFFTQQLCRTVPQWNFLFSYKFKFYCLYLFINNLLHLKCCYNSFKHYWFNKVCLKHVMKLLLLTNL